MVAQGSRRCTFSIDTVDESKNRSKDAKVHGKSANKCIQHQESLMNLDTSDESKNRFLQWQWMGARMTLG